MDLDVKKFSVIFLFFQQFIWTFGTPFDVQLIVPKNVVTSSSITLQCKFDITNVYSVKWYRGYHEFFRYERSTEEQPAIKLFSLPFLHGRVDVKASNMTHLTLKNVTTTLTGQYSCEVTTFPTFTTVKANETLYVYDSSYLQRPSIKVEEHNFDHLKSLNILCGIPPLKNSSERIPVVYYVDGAEVDADLIIYDEGRSLFILNTSLFKWDSQNVKIISCRLNLPGTIELNSDEVHLTLDSNTANVTAINFFLVFVVACFTLALR